MSAITIEAKKRETGKKASKAVRNAGLIPGVFYIKGSESISLSTTHKQLRPAVYTAETHLITLNVEGTGTMDCVLRDVTFDPVSDEIVHFDLQGIIAGHTVHVEVPIILKGQAKGVTIGGGLLEHITHKINVECLPDALPEHIDLDVTSLEVGRALHVSDLKIAGVKFLSPPETVIVVIHNRRKGGTDDAVVAPVTATGTASAKA